MKKSTLLTSLFLAGSFMASPAVFADPGHGRYQDKQARTWTPHQKQQQKHYKDERKENQRYNPNHDREHDRGDNRYYDSRSGRYLTHEQYRQLPPGLQKNVARGAVAALGINYKDLGIETGKIVGRVLKGEKPGTIKPITMNKLDLYLSPKHAQEVGITLPQDLISQAAQVEPAPKAKQ